MGILKIQKFFILMWEVCRIDFEEAGLHATICWPDSIGALKVCDTCFLIKAG